MDRISLLRFFLRTADTGSFTVASQQLGVSLASVSRGIDALEKELGTPLFVRTTRKVTLTTAGKALVKKAREILLIYDGMQSDARTIAGIAQSGELRISSSSVIAVAYLQHVILQFRSLYPQIQVDLYAADENVDPAAQAIDIAFKVGNRLPEAFVARRIGFVRSVLAASPDYLKKSSAPVAPSDLDKHECILNTYLGRSFRLVNAVGESALHDVVSTFSSNNTFVCCQMCLQGQGIAMLPLDLIAPYLDSGRLIRILPEWEGEIYNFYALTATRFMTSAARQFLSLVETHLKRSGGSVYSAFANPMP